MENAQELIQRLNHSGKKLSKSHRRIAECIVTHYDKVVFMTASRDTRFDNYGKVMVTNNEAAFIPAPVEETTEESPEE